MIYIRSIRQPSNGVLISMLPSMNVVVVVAVVVFVAVVLFLENTDNNCECSPSPDQLLNYTTWQRSQYRNCLAIRLDGWTNDSDIECTRHCCIVVELSSKWCENIAVGYVVYTGRIRPKRKPAFHEKCTVYKSMLSIYNRDRFNVTLALHKTMRESRPFFIFHSLLLYCVLFSFNSCYVRNVYFTWLFKSFNRALIFRFFVDF